MAAYAVVDVRVTDPVRYEDYKSEVLATIASYGGRYLARGGTVEALEGEWNPERLVILEFESMGRLREWYDSPEYAPLKQLRHETAASQFVVVEGL